MSLAGALENLDPLITVEELEVLEPQATNQITMSDDYITLTGNLYNRLQGRGIDLVCRLCGNSIGVGEPYHRTRTKKLYHKECWESLFAEA